MLPDLLLFTPYMTYLFIRVYRITILSCNKQLLLTRISFGVDKTYTVLIYPIILSKQLLWPHLQSERIGLLVKKYTWSKVGKARTVNDRNFGRYKFVHLFGERIIVINWTLVKYSICIYIIFPQYSYGSSSNNLFQPNS